MFQKVLVRRAALALVAAVALTVTIVAASIAAPSKSSAGSLTGAGSTFVSPLIAQWAPAYNSATGTQINYNPIGSGGGIAQITARTVDFGASDAPLTPDQFTACKGCVQIPWALSATSVMYNLPGVKNNLKMTGKVIADLFLGKITKWNDPALAKLNPGVNLPSTAVSPIFRSDGSGTTYNFTDYLSSVSGDWKSKVGVGTNVNFPAGAGARGSSGVSGLLTRTEGGITYADIAFAKANKLQFASVQNRSGKFTTPGLRGILAAAATIKKVPANNEMHIVNPPKGDKLAYPICTFTYVIVPTSSAKAADLRKFIFWALTSGQNFGPKLLFAKVPKLVLVSSEKTLKKVQGQG